MQEIIPRDKHNISRSQISPHALKVLYQLKEAGFSAFLVGGGVRDLLVGELPKDFDVATNALPEEIVFSLAVVFVWRISGLDGKSLRLPLFALIIKTPAAKKPIQLTA
jgi:hypothetical protein